MDANTSIMDRLQKYTKQLTIMLLSVEDDRETLDLLEEIFRENGFDNCKFFTNPQDAIEAINEEPSICILDYWLRPDLTGLEVLKRVKEKNKDCYVIGFTGNHDFKKMREWFNQGLNKLVDKDEAGYLNELITYVREAIAKLKDDFEWHASLLKEIEDMKKRREARHESTANR